MESSVKNTPSSFKKIRILEENVGFETYWQAICKQYLLGWPWPIYQAAELLNVTQGKNTFFPDVEH